MRLRILVVLSASATLSACANIGGAEFASPSVLSTTGMEPARPMPQSIDAEAVNIAKELHHIDDRVDGARSSGDLSRREARGLRRQNALIGDLAERYSQDGLSADEVREIEFRAGVLNDQVSSAARDPNEPD